MIAATILLFIATGALIVWLDGLESRADRGPSIEEFRTDFISRMDQELANPENFLRKKIESAHWTVKTTSARVSACSVYSVDGTDRAGKDNENIAEIDLVLTCFWDGVIQKGGYTELQIAVDGRTRQVKSCTYIGGNAFFNAETINWLEVGMAAAPYVLSFMGAGG